MEQHTHPPRRRHRSPLHPATLPRARAPLHLDENQVPESSVTCAYLVRTRAYDPSSHQWRLGIAACC
jgi:hypothetical protein